MSSALSTPLGQSHRTCKATVGHTPVSRCTCPASLNFSSVVVAAAGWINFPKRVPVFAKPQEGTSMRKDSSASKILSVWDPSMKTSLWHRRLQSLREEVTHFFRGIGRFALQNAVHRGGEGPNASEGETLGPMEKPGRHSRGGRTSIKDAIAMDAVENVLAPMSGENI